ncbi:conserved Plasmodium protein, unknown function [Plasmodium ovale]|uniref:LMBR1 domain-containing protein n=1 Tax=Plasmodium ovale TaxID=36330 RepID=A0A1D3TJF5_PLAOA|nr:conserved Plasmodium protein, unknown function [Plasmodium ovale]
MEEYALVGFLTGWLLLSVITGFRILMVYSHKDDKGRFLYVLIKFFIIIGYMVCWVMAILLPIDVYCNLTSVTKKYINIFTLYKIAYWICISYVIILTPILIILYLEVGKEENKNSFRYDRNNSVCKVWKQNILKILKNHCMLYFTKILPITFFICLITFSLFYITYISFSKIFLNLNAKECEIWYPYLKSINKKDFLSHNIRNLEHCKNIVKNDIKMNVDINYNDYLILCISFIGCLLFAFYCGIGMISFPLSFLSTYIHRNKIIKEEHFKSELSLINRNAKRLIEITEALQIQKEQMKNENYFIFFYKNLRYKKEKRVLNYLVHKLEKQYEKLLEGYHNPTSKMSSFISLSLGFLLSILSTGIFLHLVLHVALDWLTSAPHEVTTWPIRDAHNILMKENLQTLWVAVYAFLTAYLLMCAFSGFTFFCSKFNLGLIFSLERGDTYLHSLLLNMCLFFLVSSGAVLFSGNLFRRYSSHAHAFVFFDLSLKQLGFIGRIYAHNVLLYVTLAINFLTMIIFMLPTKCDFISSSARSKLLPIMADDKMKEGGKDLESISIMGNTRK